MILLSKSNAQLRPSVLFPFHRKTPPVRLPFFYFLCQSRVGNKKKKKNQIRHPDLLLVSTEKNPHLSIHYIVTYCSLPTVLLLCPGIKTGFQKRPKCKKKKKEKKRGNSWRPSDICMYRELRVLIEPGVFKYNLV